MPRYRFSRTRSWPLSARSPRRFLYHRYFTGPLTKFFFCDTIIIYKYISFFFWHILPCRRLVVIIISRACAVLLTYIWVHVHDMYKCINDITLLLLLLWYTHVRVKPPDDTVLCRRSVFRRKTIERAVLAPKTQPRPCYRYAL